jgi:hypothetical protein
MTLDRTAMYFMNKAVEERVDERMEKFQPA